MNDDLQDAATELGLGPDHNCFLGSSTLLLAQVPSRDLWGDGCNGCFRMLQDVNDKCQRVKHHRNLEC